VIDPNALVSAAISPKGTCGQLLDLVSSDQVVVVACAQLIDELRKALLYPKLRRYITSERIDGFCNSFRSRCEIQPDPTATGRHTRDPDDDYLAELALAAGAVAIVSGDNDLLDADLPAEVWSPRETIQITTGTD
jgi:putative PIN family toxin of toxin-antitoxin system